MYFLIGFLALNFIVMFHEAGHMLAAKACGVGVVEYSIGMGPCLWTKRIGDTVYSLRLFFIGGYCAMHEEEAIEAAKPEEKKKDHWYDKFLPKPDYKTDFDDRHSYVNKTWWQRVFILFAGPLANFILAWIIAFIVILSTGAASRPVVLDFAEESTVAKDAGIEIGDTIVQVDNRKVYYWKNYKGYLDLHKYTKDGYWLTVKKPSGDLYRVWVVPNEAGIIGIQIDNERVPVSLGEAVLTTHRELHYWFTMTFDGLGAMINKEYSIKDMSGIVGATRVMGEETKKAVDSDGWSNGVFTLAQMIVLLSTNIGVMNLIPFPVLDGGRIVFTLGEAVTRRRLSTKLKYAIEASCMLVLLSFTLYVMVKDLMQIFAQI